MIVHATVTWFHRYQEQIRVATFPRRHRCFDIAFQKPTIIQSLATVSVIVIATGLSLLYTIARHSNSTPYSCNLRQKWLRKRDSATNKFYLNNGNSTKHFLWILEFFQQLSFDRIDRRILEFLRLKFLPFNT